MPRRGLMGTAAALAQAAFVGVSAEAADVKTKAACECTACTCDAKAKVAGQACECCGGPT